MREEELDWVFVLNFQNLLLLADEPTLQLRRQVWAQVDMIQNSDLAIETLLDQTRIDFRPTLVRRSQNCSLLTWSELSAEQIAQATTGRKNVAHDAPLPNNGVRPRHTLLGFPPTFGP